VDDCRSGQMLEKHLFEIFETDNTHLFEIFALLVNN
jgi:hypothetical protein